MKNSFWKKQVVCGHSVKLDTISSVYGGYDPVANWQGGYTAFFSIDNYNTGYVSIDVCGDMAKIAVAVGVEKNSQLAKQLLSMCLYNSPRVGDVFDNPEKWG